MIVSKERFLIQLSKQPGLADNTIAYIFAVNPSIDISSRENFFNNIITYFKRFKEAKPEIELPIENPSDILFREWIGKDLRIKKMYLSSIRGFPKSTKPFGIDYCNSDGEPQSMIILGGNGTGKSSVFDSIEYCYCNSVGEAQIRGFKGPGEDNIKFLDFLEHNSEGVDQIFCQIQTVSELLKISGKSESIPMPIRHKINPDTHFISDYDIYSKGQLDYEKNTKNSFHNTIAESLGLKDLLDFEKQLKAFTLYRRLTESRNVAAIKKSNDIQNKLIESNNKSIVEKNLQLEAIRQSEKQTPLENVNIDLTRILTDSKRRQISIEVDVNTLAKEIELFKTEFSKLELRQKSKDGLSEINFLSLGLELLKDSNNCPFCRDTNLSVELIADNVSKRIEDIRDGNEAAQSVNRLFTIVINGMSVLRSEMDLLISKAEAEIALVKGHSEFNELLLRNNKLIQQTRELMSSEEYIGVFIVNEDIVKQIDRENALFKLLQNHASFLTQLFLNFVQVTIKKFVRDRAALLSVVENNLKEKRQITTSGEQIIILTREIAQMEKQNTDANQTIEKDNIRIRDLNETISQFEEVRVETNLYVKAFHAALNEEVNLSFSPIKLIVEEVLEKYFKVENREIELVISKEPDEFDEESGEVLSEVITAKIRIHNSNVPLQPVNKYLNTFHYRLFSAMVGISIAIASRRNTGVNLPLVLDDVFYASDFENRSHIEEFLSQIFKAFKAYTPSMPLQLIMFTHDQLIFECVIKAAGRHEISDIAFAKLFPFREAIEETDYRNLVFKYPEYYPKTIINKLFAVK